MSSYCVFVQVVERRKQIEVEEKEITRKDRELKAIVKLPAEAEAYKVQTLAEGHRCDPHKTQIYSPSILSHWSNFSLNDLISGQ